MVCSIEYQNRVLRFDLKFLHNISCKLLTSPKLVSAILPEKKFLEGLPLKPPLESRLNLKRNIKPL